MLNTHDKQQSFIHSCPFSVCMIILIILLMTPRSGYSQKTGTMQTSETSIGFKVKSFGFQVAGKFTDHDITVILDSQSLEAGHIKARISVASISTGISKRDEHLMTEKYFDVEEHPFIEFESKKIRQIDDKSYLAQGNLKIKGIQRSIEIPFKIIENDGLKILTSKFELNRLDYRVGGKNWTMGDIVKIAVSYNFKN